MTSTSSPAYGIPRSDATTTLIATPAEYTEQLRSGTWSTIRYARKHRRHIIVVYPDGSTNEDRND